MDVQISGKSYAASRAADATLPQRGVLDFTYVFCEADELPKSISIAGTRFQLQLEHPWDFWTANALLRLAQNGACTWVEADCEGVLIRTSPLPTHLPNFGLLRLRVAAPASHAPPPPMKYCMQLNLMKPSHRAAARQLVALGGDEDACTRLGLVRLLAAFSHPNVPRNKALTAVTATGGARGLQNTKRGSPAPACALVAADGPTSGYLATEHMWKDEAASDYMRALTPRVTAAGTVQLRPLRMALHTKANELPAAEVDCQVPAPPR